VELALTIRQIWERRLWLVPVAAVAVIAALAVLYRVSLVPPGLQSKSLEYGVATSQILLQASQPATAAPEPEATSNVVSPAQASVYAALLQAQPVRSRIGRIAKLPAGAIAIESHLGPEGEVGAVQRSSQLLAKGQTASLAFSLEPEVPIVTLYAQAPTAGIAERIVVGANKALGEYVNKLQARNPATEQQVKLVPLGEPEAGELASGASVALAILVAAAVLVTGCLLIVFIPRMATAFRRAGALDELRGEPTPITAVQRRPTVDHNGSGPGAVPEGQKRADRD